MATSIEKVKATNIDGIEFYCSSNGEQTGMSQTGLAKFCGLPKSTVWRLLSAIDANDSKKIPEGLKHLALVDIYHGNLHGYTGGAPSAIVSAEVCAEICAWAAYEFNGGNKVARFSLKKFAATGIKNFIQEVTGFLTIGAESNTNAILLSLIGKMDAKLDCIETRLERTEGYLKARVEYPGLKDWMESIDIVSEQPLLEGSVELYTINEAIAKIYPGTTLSRAHKTSLSRTVMEVYRAMKLDPPAQVIRPNKVGYNSPPVNAFPETMFPVIKACFARVVQL